MGTSHKDIEARRAELQNRLHKLEAKLDDRFVAVKSGVSESLSVKKLITKNPLLAVGLSVAAGILVGRPSSSGTRTKKGVNRKSGDDVVTIVGRSLKKRIAQKAIDTIMDMVEEQLANSTHKRSKH